MEQQSTVRRRWVRNKPHTSRSYPVRFAPARPRWPGAACCQSDAIAPEWPPRLPRWLGRQDLRAHVPLTGQVLPSPSKPSIALHAWPAIVVCIAPVLFGPLQNPPFPSSFGSRRTKALRASFRPRGLPAGSVTVASLYSQYNRENLIRERNTDPGLGIRPMTTRFPRCPRVSLVSQGKSRRLPLGLAACATRQPSIAR